MSHQIPAEFRALVQDGDKSSSVGTVKSSQLNPGPKDVVVKTLYVSQNPTDWKHTWFGLAPKGSVSRFRSLNVRLFSDHPAPCFSRRLSAVTFRVSSSKSGMTSLRASRSATTSLVWFT